LAWSPEPWATRWSTRRAQIFDELLATWALDRLEPRE
jgi:hypothetical protein